MGPNGGQPNPGSFMGPSAGGQPQMGPALMRLMQLRQMGATPQAGNNTVLPAAPNATNAINPSQISRAGQQPPPPPQPGAPSINPGASMATNDPNLSIAMQALANYAKAHSEGILADKGVHMAKANAKVREAQAPQTGATSGAPVS